MQRSTSLKVFVVAIAISLSKSVWGGCSPLVIDLDRDGFDFGQAGDFVQFDINADGVSDALQWVAEGEDEAFLALDRNQNGTIDDGSELFGIATPLLLETDDEDSAPNGFIGLGQYDHVLLGGNGDEVITREDWVWQELILWLDDNADGVSQPEEIHSLESLGVVSLETAPKRRDVYDEAGNWMPLWAWGGLESPPYRTRVVDVYFQTR